MSKGKKLEEGILMGKLSSLNDKGEKMKKHEQGYTLIEILVCFVMIMAVVIPISNTLVTYIKTKENAQQMSKSIVYAERLLEEIKGELKKSAIDQKQKFPSFDEFFLNTSSEKLEERYDLTHYAYEVAIWNREDMALNKGSFKGGEQNLNQPIWIFSDIEFSESLEVEEDESEIWPSLSVKEELLRELEKAADYKVDNGSVYKSKISFLSGTSHIDNDSREIIIENIRAEEGNGQRYIYIISTEQALEGMSILEVNFDKLSEEADFSLEFINYLNIDQLICLKGEKPENISVLIRDKGEGSSILLQEETSGNTFHYVIAAVIRVKDPIQGKRGKIVKKAIDLYSFDV